MVGNRSSRRQGARTCEGGDAGDRHDSGLDRRFTLLSAHHPASRTDVAQRPAGWALRHDVLDHPRKCRGMGDVVSAHRRIRRRGTGPSQRSGGVADPSPAASQPAVGGARCWTPGLPMRTRPSAATRVGCQRMPVAPLAGGDAHRFRGATVHRRVWTVTAMALAMRAPFLSRVTALAGCSG